MMTSADIRAARARLKLSQEKFAVLVGLTRLQVIDLEAGKFLPTERTENAIRQAVEAARDAA